MTDRPSAFGTWRDHRQDSMDTNRKSYLQHDPPWHWYSTPLCLLAGRSLTHGGSKGNQPWKLNPPYGSIPLGAGVAPALSRPSKTKVAGSASSLSAGVAERAGAE